MTTKAYAPSMNAGANRLGYNSQGRLTLDGVEMTYAQLYGAGGQQSGAEGDSAPDEAGGYVPGHGATADWDELQRRGRHQLRSTGVSSGEEGQGFGEVRGDRVGGLQWDPRFGVTTGDASDIEDTFDPDERARMNRWRTAVLIAMTAGAALEFAPALMGGEIGSSAALLGDAEMALASQTVAGGGVTGAATGGGAGLAANLGLDAFEAGSFASAGAPELGMASGYGPAAGGGALGAGGAGGGGGGSGGGVGDFLSNAYDSVSNLFTPGPEQLSGPGAPAWGSVGGNSSSAGGNFISNLLDMPDFGISNQDLFGLGRDLIGGYMDDRQQGRDRQTREAEAERSRQFGRETRFTNTTGPTGTSNWARGADGQWTQTRTLTPEDQRRLDQYRQLILGSQARQAAMPETDWSAVYKPFRGASFGGSYVAPDRYANLRSR